MEYLSSYEMIQTSKFGMVYKSSIGLEASIMGSAVLAAGRSRYTAYPTVFFPENAKMYFAELEKMLGSDELTVPEEHRMNSRRFLYYQLFKTALPFDEFLAEAHRPGLVLMRKFSPDKLYARNSQTIRTILNGIQNEKPFILEES
jgi:hypothetical protein